MIEEPIDEPIGEHAGDPVFSHDRYQVVEEIGRGGMGLVYRCRDLKLDKDVAVKVVAWSFDDDDAARFHMEARLLAQLSHPNILTVLDFGYSDDGTLFLVTDMVSGRSLDRRIAENGAFEPPDAVPIFVQILEGIAHAHAGGILHRDIKPSNIMLVDRDKNPPLAVILDFGLGKLMAEDQRLTRTGAMMGSPPYMSPEQASGKSVDERSDIYSMGCLVFEVLTGRKPFEGQNVHATMLMQVQKPPPTLGEIVPERQFAPELEAIVARCLAKDPDDRFQSALELRGALLDYVEADRARSSSLVSGVHAISGVYKRINISPRASRTIFVVASIAVGLIAFGVMQTAGNLKGTRSERPEGPDLSDFSEQAIMKSDEARALPPVIEHKPEQNSESEMWQSPSGKNCSDAEYLEFVSKEKPEDLRIAGEVVTDAALVGIGKSEAATAISGLKIVGTGLSDNALAAISGFPSLEELIIEGAKNISDRGIEHLVDCPRLSALELRGLAVTDDCLESLGKRAGLQSLSLLDCKSLKGKGLRKLDGLNILNTLSLRGSGIVSRNLREVVVIPNLMTLDISDLDIRDDDLAALNQMRLVHLNLAGNQHLTDQGLYSLYPMTSLVTLVVSDCKGISDEAVKTFCSRLTRTKIIRYAQ
ncbi:MAG: protein kinase [Candidatus Obscuribacterales bacterium]